MDIKFKEAIGVKTKLLTEWSSPWIGVYV
jgi:hypothetical protein